MSKKTKHSEEKYITPSGSGPDGKKYYKECDTTISYRVKLRLFPTGNVPLKLDPTSWLPSADVARLSRQEAEAAAPVVVSGHPSETRRCSELLAWPAAANAVIDVRLAVESTISSAIIQERVGKE